MRLFLICVSCLICISVVDALQITEVMYDPIGSDVGNEWIEIFNDENSVIDISILRLKEDNVNHFISSYSGINTLDIGGYAVIVDDPENFLIKYPEYDGLIFDSTFSLLNSGESISMYYPEEDKILASFSYINQYGGSNNGFSLSLIGGEIMESVPTPGKVNFVRDVCDWGIDIISDNIFSNGNDVGFDIILEKDLGEEGEIYIHRVIEDEHGNIVKKYNPLKKQFSKNSITKKISLSPNLDEGKPYILKSSIINLSCNDTNLNNNIVEKLIFVNSEILSLNSEIAIEDILDLGSDKEAKFGEIIRAKLSIYKGDTTKNVVKAYLKKGTKRASKESKVSLPNNFQLYELTIPITIKPNCDDKLDSGNYELIVEGFDTDDSDKVEIEGKIDAICGGKEKKRSKIASYVKIIDLPKKVKNQEDFEIEVELSNGDSEKHGFEVYSYVYSGKKIYSKDKKHNLRKITLDPKEVKRIGLLNNVVIEKEGDYQIKVNLKQDNLKTLKTDTETVHVKLGKVSFEQGSLELFDEALLGREDKSENIEEEFHEPEKETRLSVDQKNERGEVNSGSVIYESSQEHIKKIIPVFLIILSILVNILFIIKN